MKKRIFLSATIITAVFLLMAGATFAYFTDSAVNANNLFTAGTVEITANRDLGDPIPGPMFYTNFEQGQTPSGANPNWPTGLWYPGKTETKTLIVTNTGTLNAKIDGISADVTNISESLAQDFASYMNVVVRPQAMPSLVIYDGPLSGLLSGQVNALNNLPIAATGVWYLDFIITMSEDAGNSLQGVDPRVAFTIYASQN